MYQVVPDRSDALRVFFAEPLPNAPMLEAFLDLRAPGRAFVNDYLRPSACIVTMNYSFVFLGGEVTRHFFEQSVRRLRQEQDVMVVWTRHRLPPEWPAPDVIVARLEYRRRENGGNGRSLGHLRKAGGQVDLRRIDSALLRRCFWRDEVIRATGSEREFLNHGLGFCLVVNGQVVSEAYACFWGRERLEIATVTHPDHRGRGYAAAVCAHLIEACEGLGFSTYWSCDTANQPSRVLAEKLGFRDPQPYQLLVYRKRAG